MSVNQWLAAKVRLLSECMTSQVLSWLMMAFHSFDCAQSVRHRVSAQHCTIEPTESAQTIDSILGFPLQSFAIYFCFTRILCVFVWLFCLDSVFKLYDSKRIAIEVKANLAQEAFECCIGGTTAHNNQCSQRALHSGIELSLNSNCI